MEYPFNKTETSALKFVHYEGSNSVKDSVFATTFELELPNDTLFENDFWLYTLSPTSYWGVEKVRELIHPNKERTDFIRLVEFLPNLSSDIFLYAATGFLHDFYSCHGENNVQYSLEVVVTDFDRDKNTYEGSLADAKEAAQFGVKVVDLPTTDNHRAYLAYKTHDTIHPEEVTDTNFEVTYELGKYGYLSIIFNYDKMDQFGPCDAQAHDKARHLTEQDMIEISKLFVQSIKSVTFEEVKE